tara:strand:- start:101197 stop:101496 length:300 start_codon:yes stop_codon:yes gene_type:complete
MSKIINRTFLYTQRFAINLVTYYEDHFVPRHLDMVSSGRLYKLNFVLVQPQQGGIFETEGVIFSFFNRIILFRPDLYEHRVTKIIRGKRVLLSFALRLN